MIYDVQNPPPKLIGKKAIIAIIIALIAVIGVIINNIYLEVVQYQEIGNLQGIYIKNFTYKLIFAVIAFVIIFIVITATNFIIIRNVKRFLRENNFPQRKLPNLTVSAIIAFVGALLTKDYFYQKALTFLNSTFVGKQDPIFQTDIGYYFFQRPFLMSIYDFFSTFWMFVIFFTVGYYMVIMFLTYNGASPKDLKINAVIRHNLINIAIFFIIKTFSYQFLKQGILNSSFISYNGAGYIDVNIWMKYFTVAPILLIVIVVVALLFIMKGKLKQAAITIAIFPAVWIIVSVVAGIYQSFIVRPNGIFYESQFLKYNMEQTRDAYNISNIKNIEFPALKSLTSDIINRNLDTKDSIRIVDYKATLDTNTQLQSNTNFYSFQDGDIINYTINGKEIPIFMAAREIDKRKLPEKSYVNTMFKYTHGYGIVINPINKLTPEGQVDYILSGLRMDSVDKNIKVNEPKIYYGELTNDYVITNVKNNLKEIDYDGNAETVYGGTGGVKLGFLNRLQFAIKYGDFNMLISGYISSDSKLLLNRNILLRAQKAVPFLSVDKDPYILLTPDGRLKWILDAYTTSQYYPYSQNINTDIGSFNYIRNSVKIVIDAYDGTVQYYIIDSSDPIIKTYKKIYPGLFQEGPIPEGIASHMRYPEFLFKIQTEVLKKYHIDPNSNPGNLQAFYSNQDMWDIGKLPVGTGDNKEERYIDPYYNLIKLPAGVGTKEELVLMRPFTPSNKNNMISWLAVRNSNTNYGELVFYTFPKNTNIYGPYQVESKINQIDQVSKDMTLWGQSGSTVFKGNLMIIPIEESVLYVEPIYIQSQGQSIPEVREVVVGYQSGEEFKYGIGINLDDALNKLFKGIVPTAEVPKTTPPTKAATPTAPSTAAPPTTPGQTNQQLINEIMQKYDSMKKQMDEMGGLINQLKQ